MTRDDVPGARWLRCDLHVHTPFDPEKRFGENVKHAVEAFKREKPQRLAEIASRFIEACRMAAGGKGMDLVALTDHNSIDGYRYLKPQFDTIAQQAKDMGLRMPVILPGVEFTVGGERPLHFLVIFAAQTNPTAIDGIIRHVFGEREPFDPTSGTPRATGNSVDDFLKKLHDFCRPTSGDRRLSCVMLPAHADGDRGVEKETRAREPGIAPSIWDAMKGHLRQWVLTRCDWNGFQTLQPYHKLPQAFQDLLARWIAARRDLEWDTLTERERQRIRETRHWPLIEASDPHCYEDIGTRFTWLKMEVPDVEGIRLALLDPESRLRRMAEGRPGHTYPVIRRLAIRGTDFFEHVEIPLNPSLNTLIGGRGSGKSTAIECLRYALDRAHAEDFADDEAEILEAVGRFLSRKRERDFGESPGMLLPGHEVDLEVEVASRLYRVTRSERGIEVVPDPQGGEPQIAPMDVRTLLAPRILSQRQIARIARDPAAQRRELDALAEPDVMRGFTDRQRALLEEVERLQATRRTFKERAAAIPARETELQTVKDQIEFLERGGNKEVLDRFRAYQTQQRWLQDALKTLDEAASRLEAEATQADESRDRLGAAPQGPTAAWTGTIQYI